MKIAIYTLGCKVNQYETQAMETELRRRGHDLVPFEGPADAYIVNTCTVTAVSDHKSRQAIRRARKSNPAALVAVCGCYAQTDPQAVAALGVDLVGGADRRLAFLDDLERLAEKKLMSTAKRQLSKNEALFSKTEGKIQKSGGVSEGVTPPSVHPTPTLKIMSTEEEPIMSTKPENIMSTEAKAPSPLVTTGDIMSARTFEALPAGGLEGRTRAMLKVEDGCVNFCSYCVIPYARGPVRSLPLAQAVSEARRLMEEGYKELVVTGIEISSWGRDLPGKPPLAELIEAICAAAPRCRVRLGSLEPRTVTEDFCRRLSGLHNLCPHFHLSLQSGCDATLKRMNRRYDTARYYESVTLLRQWFDRPGLTTDLIAGFPGETEAEFLETLAFLQKCAFSAVHIFPYSRRAGTPAASMPDQVPRREQEARCRRAAQTAARTRAAYLQTFVSQTLPVLFEEEKEGFFRGYAPNYVEVRVPLPDGLHNISLHNIEKPVRITALAPDFLLGELSQKTDILTE